MIDEKEVNAVFVLAEERNFSQAAKRLFITQPTLSACIKKIENELGIELFDRRQVPLQLTEAGQIYLQKTQKLLEIRHDIQNSIDDLSNLQSGHLRIGSSHSRTAYLLSRVLPEYKKLYPGIELALIEGTTLELQEYAHNGMTDVSLTYLPLSYKELDAELLDREEIMAAVPAEHRLAVKYNIMQPQQSYPMISFKELAADEFIIMKSNRKMREIFFRLCEKYNIYPKILLESHSLISAQALVGTGCGVTLVTDMLARYYELKNNPCYFSLGESDMYRELVAVYRNDKQLSKAAQAFISLTKQIIKE